MLCCRGAYRVQLFCISCPTNQCNVYLFSYSFVSYSISLCCLLHKDFSLHKTYKQYFMQKLFCIGHIKSTKKTRPCKTKNKAQTYVSNVHYLLITNYIFPQIPSCLIMIQKMTIYVPTLKSIGNVPQETYLQVLSTLYLTNLLRIKIMAEYLNILQKLSSCIY